MQRLQVFVRAVHTVVMPCKICMPPLQSYTQKFHTDAQGPAADAFQHSCQDLCVNTCDTSSCADRRRDLQRHHGAACQPWLHQDLLSLAYDSWYACFAQLLLLFTWMSVAQHIRPVNGASPQHPLLQLLP